MSYKHPLERGFVQFKVPKKDHNEIFEHRQIKWTCRYEYFISENSIEMHKYISLRAKLVNVLLYPLNLILYGLSSFKDVNDDFYKIWFQRKTASYSSDYISKNHNSYNKLKKYAE